MNFVLDASVALAWCFEDEGGAYATSVLSSLSGSEAVVPALWPLEVSNGLWTAEQRGRIDARHAARASRLLLDLPIAVEPMVRSRPFDAVHRLARAHQLSTYDAAYLELAGRLGLELATLDRPLLQAMTTALVGAYLGGPGRG